MIPAVGINAMVIGQTTQMVKNVDGESVLDFLVEENLGESELKEFQLEMKHNPNISYLANKTNSINQTLSNRPNATNQFTDLPWLRQDLTSPGRHTPRGSTPRSKRGHVTLSQVFPTTRQTRSHTLASVLQQNPLPNMNQNETSNKTTDG
ncbi:hypothetical protein RclHR1_00900026 [Rhizophagus clarus]|nr:hypothetical protein RclHR1_00900026 [Rhizophagus clarus]